MSIITTFSSLSSVKSLLRRGVVVAAASAALALTAAGVASAAPTTPAAPAWLPQSQAAVGVSPKLSTTGFDITNDSSAILVFQKSTGGLPGPTDVGGVWMPGQKFNFEAKYCWTTDCYGDAYFEAYHPDGTDLGQLDVHLDGDYEDGYMTLNGAEQDVTGATLTTNQSTTVYDNSPHTWALWAHADNEILDNGSGVWHLDNTDRGIPGVTPASLVQAVCQAAGSQCAYNASSVTPGMGPYTLLTYGYDPRPVDGAPDRVDGSLSAGNEMSTSQTNTYGMSISAGINIADVINAGVTKDSSQSFTTESSFSTNDTENKYPQQTTAIYGSAPVFEADGTLTATIGNTSWTFFDANFTYPRLMNSDGTKAAVAYQPSFLPGDVTPPEILVPQTN